MKITPNTIITGDILKILPQIPPESVDCIVTSPPYWGLRDYGSDGQIGLEKTVDEYLANLLLITSELKRILKSTGTMWWNHGDSYGTGSGAGKRNGLQRTNRGTQNFEQWKKDGKSKVDGYEKSLLLQPYRLAQLMTDRQKWILRNIIIWRKPNAMPSSVKDRFSNDYEPILFFVKSKKYYFEQQLEPFQSNEYDLKRMAGERKVYDGKWSNSDNHAAVPGDRAHIQKAFVAGSDGGRNKRSVWDINTKPYSEAHFATFPESLIETPIKAGCPGGGYCV